MSNFSEIAIRQYTVPDGSSSVGEKVFLWESDNYCRDTKAGTESTYNILSYFAFQHPRPMHQTIQTLVPSNWSDSPANSPTLPDSQRYSYGRFGEALRYGSLDRYSGAIISQRFFGMSSENRVYEFISVSDGLVRDDVLSTNGESVVYDSELVSNFVILSIYNILLNASPAPFSYKNPVDSDVYIRLGNYVYTLNPSTITLSLNGVNKTPLSIVPYVGGLGGYDVTWTNDDNFGYGEQVNVRWVVYDTYSPPNRIEINYWFTTVPDYIGPRFYSFSPSDGDIDVEVDTCIEFTIRDSESGINIDSLEFYVNNVLVGSGDMVVTELDTEDGYSVSFCPAEKFLYGDTIPVSIYIEDSSDEHNYSFYVYSFTTKSSDPPRVLGHSPRACIGYVPVDYDVEIDLVDGGGGLEKDSIILIIDNKPVVFRKEPIVYRED